MKRAVPLLLLAACAHPPAPDARELYFEGRRLETVGRIDEALAMFARAIEVDPWFIDARLSRAEVLAGQGRYAAAVAEYDGVLDRHVNRPEAIGGRALVYGLMGRHPDGVADATKLIALQPKSPDAYLLRGWLYTLDGKPAEAHLDYHEARRLGRDAWRRYYNAGVDALQHQRYDTAERSFALASQLAPDRVESFIALGRTHVEMGKYGDAVEDYSRAIDAAPDPELYFHRANANIAMRSYVAALRDLDHAIVMMPRQAAFHYARALTFVGLHAPRAALKDLTTCLDLQPLHREARIQRAHLYLAAQCPEAAEADLQAALEIQATPQTIRLLARIYREKENWDRAVYYLETALRICTEDDVRESLKTELEECRKRK